jgi:hypothetical protein
MKMFAFAMAIIVLVLSIMPCADAKAVTKGIKTELKQDRLGGDSHNDNCSPFCQCACCAGFSINHKVPGFTSITAFVSKPKSPYLPSNIFKIALPIWQPPQLIS